MELVYDRRQKPKKIVRILNRIEFWIPCIIKLLFEAAYILRFSPLYSYLGATYSPNYQKMAISWIPVILYVLVPRRRRKTKLSIMFTILFYLSAVPSFSIYWLKNENTTAFWLITLYWVMWWLAVQVFNWFNRKEATMIRLVPDRFTPSRTNLLLNMLYLISVAGAVYLSWKYGHFRLFINLDDVYTYRLAEENRMGTVMSYFFAWNTNFILPFFLSLHFLQKNWKLFAVDTVMILLSYGIYGNKTMLFSIALVFGVIILSRIGGLKYIDTMIAGFITLYLLLILCMGTSKTMFIALGDRILQGPAAGHYNYYDFFQYPGRPFLYLRDSFLRFISPSPYSETISRLIGSSAKYYSGAYNNMNNGLFSTAYSELGIPGIFIQPVFTVFLVSLNLKIIRRYDNLIQDVLLVLHVLYLISTSTVSWLLTGGLLVEMISLYCIEHVRLGNGTKHLQSNET